MHAPQYSANYDAASQHPPMLLEIPLTLAFKLVLLSIGLTDRQDDHPQDEQQHRNRSDHKHPLL